jgi:CBS domain-containing protein
VYHALLVQDNVHLPSPLSRIPAGTWRAGDVMARDLTFIPKGSSVEGAWKLVAENQSKCFLVGSQEMLAGLVTRKSIEEAMHSGQAADPVTAVLAEGWMHVHPDHPLELALERFKRNPGLLPVLNRSGTRRVEGVITLETIRRFLETNPEE